MPRRKGKLKDSDDDYQNSSDDEDEADFKYVPVKTEIVEGSDEESLDFEGAQTETWGSGSRRAKRKAAVKIKEEPQSDPPSDSDNGGGGFEGDSDYLMDEDEEETKKKKKKRSSGTWKKKKVSEMSEEEREKMKAKWREEARQRRAKKREEMKDRTKNEEKRRSSSKRKPVAEMTEEEREEVKAKWREEARQRRAKKRESMGMSSGAEDKEEGKILNKSRSQSKRKPVAMMGEEEREAMKIKWREEARQRRAKKKQQMTEEEKKEEMKKTNEQRKKLRWKKMAEMGKSVRVKKEGGEKGKRKPLTEEEKEKKREWRRKWRANMSEEEKAMRRQRWRDLRREKRAEMTVEERRMKDYMDRQARLARMTKEEREEEKERLKKRRLERMGGTEEHKEYQRKWREGMTEEKKDRFRRQLRESYYRKMDRIKKDPELLQKWRDKNKEWYQRKVLKSLETGVPFRKSRKGGGICRTTPGEQCKQSNQREIESLRIWRRKQDIRKRLEIQKMLEEGMDMEQIYKKLDPYGGDEEKRRRRLIRQRVNKQKLNLRRQLEGMGVAEEEIKRRVEEVAMTYQPTLQFRPFKLSSKSLEPVGPEEMKLLEEDEMRQKFGRFRTGTKVEVAPPAQQRSLPQLQQQQKSLPQQSSVPPAPQQQTYSLEHFLHGMNSNYSAAAPPPPPPLQPACSLYIPSTSTHHPPAPPPQPTYQHYESSYSSSQHEYQQSNYTNSPPPASPLGGDDDNYEDEDHQPHQSSQFLYNSPPQPSPVTPQPINLHQPQSSKRAGPGRPRTKPKRSLPHRKGTPGPPSGPRGARTNKKPIVRDTICEDCGNAYNHQYIQEHKTSMHNPNFVNGKCVYCGEAFTNGRTWYRHFLKLHLVKGGDNDTRKKKAGDPNKTGLFCDACGAGFATRMGLHKHMYYMHGDGMKKENYIKCPICPEEKMFKTLHSYQNHMRNHHPENTEAMKRECFRCEKFFKWEDALSEHVRREHPESYWPCKWCKACRFSKYGLNFHLRKCRKGGREEAIKEGESLLEEDLGCEFCGRTMKLTSMTRHYREVHGVREKETFSCTEKGCRAKGGKAEFKRRDYWVVHLEEKHGKKWEELREWVWKCNLREGEREGLVVENEEGKNKRPEGGKKRWTKWKRREWDEEEDGKVRRERRNVKVIAEEDEKMEDSLGE